MAIAVNITMVMVRITPIRPGTTLIAEMRRGLYSGSTLIRDGCRALAPSSGIVANCLAVACTEVSLPSTSTCTASRPSIRRRSKSGGITMPILILPSRNKACSSCGVRAPATGRTTPVANISCDSAREPPVPAMSATAAGRLRTSGLIA